MSTNTVSRDRGKKSQEGLGGNGQKRLEKPWVEPIGRRRLEGDRTVLLINEGGYGGIEGRGAFVAY